jgi:hypothetical protein
VNDFEIVAIRIEHPRGIVARIVLESSPRWLLALASRVYSGLVERVDLGVVLRFKSDVDCWGMGFPLLEPEESPLAIAKSLQVGMPVMTLVVSEVGDSEGLQGLGVERD